MSKQASYTKQASCQEPVANTSPKIPTRLHDWPTTGLRRVSVNSFGFGGANAHVVLDDAFNYLRANGQKGFHHCVDTAEAAAPVADVVPNGATNSTESLPLSPSISGDAPKQTPKLLIWSAQDQGAAKRMLDNYAQYYHEHIAGDPGRLNQLSYTLAKRRSAMVWRSFAIADEAANEPIKQSTPVRVTADTTGIAFVFTGQGAQYAGMGIGLMDYPVFAKSILASETIFRKLGAPWSLIGMSFYCVQCRKTS